MADIFYNYKNQLYANITNRCDCNCQFCVRSLKDIKGEIFVSCEAEDLLKGTISFDSI